MSFQKSKNEQIVQTNDKQKNVVESQLIQTSNIIQTSEIFIQTEFQIKSRIIRCYLFETIHKDKFLK